VGSVMRRDEHAVDIRGRDSEREVVADEAPPGQTRISGPGARVLGESVDLLARLLGIPGELRDSQVGPDGDRATAAVLVRLERDVDAEIRLAHVGRKDAGVVRAGLPAVIELDSDRPARTGSHRRLELVGRNARRVDVVVYFDWRRPCETAVGRLRELD